MAVDAYLRFLKFADEPHQSAKTLSPALKSVAFFETSAPINASLIRFTSIRIFSKAKPAAILRKLELYRIL